MTARDDASVALAPYVAPLALEWLATAPDRRHLTLDATLVFVDVSGFTALTERLAAQGKAGAEEVSDVIGDAFAELLAVSDENGGELLKWGGDAALLLFRGEGAPARGCRSAFLMSKLMARIGKVRTSAGRIALGVSAGIASGLVDLYLLGDEYRELIVSGPVATATAQMESEANAGEVLVAAATAALIDPDALGEPRGGGVLLRAAPGDLITTDPAGPAELPTVDPARLLSPPLRRHLAGGGERAEHRYASIAFIEFDGVDEVYSEGGPAAVANALDPLIGLAQRAADDHEVTFYYTDIARDGGKILMTGGVPVASGNDEERLLRATARVVHGYDGPLVVRAGLNAGRFFVHDAGTATRRVHSFSGDAVNLAARVMARAAAGEVLATRTLLARVRSEVHSVDLEPFLVKGKTEPVEAARVVDVEAASEATIDAGAFVGRAAELEAIAHAAKLAENGSGQVIDIVAEPGMGKSRLVTEAAARSSLAVRRVICESYGDAAPYTPFVHLVRALLGVAPGAEPRRAAAVLQETVTERAPELADWLPLLVTLVGASLPSTAAVRQLEPRFRRDRLESAAIDLFDAIVPPASALVFEDVHAADNASRSLIARLAAAVASRPWLLVLTRRAGSELELPKGATRLALESLTSEESASLIGSVDGTHTLLPHERRALLERASGRPLFLRELVEGYRLTRSIDALPDSLEPLLALQVDELAPVDRSLLRAAAVLGVWFDLTTLADLVDVDVRDEQVWSRLAPFVVDESEDRKRFRHSIVRDAAYEGLSYRRRRDLHGKAAESIAVRAIALEEHAGLLSLHYLHADQHAEAWRYARVAGDDAVEQYANTEAVAYFRRALAAAARLPVPAPQIAQVWESLGDAAERSGDYEAASTASSRARGRFGTAVDRARTLRKAGIVHERSGRYRLALTCYTRGHRLVDGRPERDDAVERCELTMGRAAVRFRQGKHRECLASAEDARAEASAISYRPGLAHALFLQDMALEGLGRDAHGVALEALAIYEELRDLIGQANVLNNLGVDAYFRGKWDDALDLWTRSNDARERAGDVTGAATQQNNIAEILSDQGHGDRARALLETARETWVAAGYEIGVAIATSNLGRLAARGGRFDDARRLLTDARDRFQAIGSADLEFEAGARFVEALIFEGRVGEARREAAALDERARVLVGAGAAGTMTTRLLAVAIHRDGDAGTGADELHRCVERAQAQGEDFELALALASEASLTHQDRCESVSCREAAALALTMFEALGVVDIPVTSIDDRWPARGVAIGAAHEASTRGSG